MKSKKHKQRFEHDICYVVNCYIYGGHDSTLRALHKHSKDGWELMFVKDGNLFFKRHV